MYRGQGGERGGAMYGDKEEEEQGEEVLTPLARQYLDNLIGYYQQLSDAEQTQQYLTSDLSTFALASSLIPSESTHTLRPVRE